MASWGIEERGTIDAMSDWIAGYDDRPFFITYIPVWPHHPYRVPNPKYERFKRPGKKGKYLNAIYYFDEMVEYLLEKLYLQNVRDDTLFIFVGDHGEGFGEHPGSKAHGSRLYEETAKSLAIWYAPGALSKRYDDPRISGHVEIAPTLLDLVNIPIPQTYPMPSAATPGPKPMVPLYTGYSHPYVGFVDGQRKVIINRRTGRVEIYDLETDADEHLDLSAQLGDAAKRYKERGEQFAAAQKAWEEALDDLREEDEKETGEAREWRTSPDRCKYDEKFFNVVGGELHVHSRGKTTIECEYPLGDVRKGRLSYFGVRGFEAINGAYITSKVFWQQGDDRKNLAYCTLNGSISSPAFGCEAVIVPAMTEFGGGGKLIVEFYVHQVHTKPPATDFLIHEAKLGFTAVN
jgi:hypothetical protein